ncbi:hypothetical protein KBD49_04425 [Myxococcota bacterium]|nr:hypothetical protein [Myxococcota bacterium]
MLVSFPSVVQAQDEAGPFFERVPEAAGLLEWMRSLGGIDLRSADRTREEGWDPGRPWGAAWRAGEWWITLPVEAEGRVRRRLGLRMARLGMVARESPGPGVFFQDLRDPRRRAWALVEGGVARICLSGEDGCQAPPPPGADPGGVPARIEAVAREAGLERPALVFQIAGDARMRLLPKDWRSRWPGGLAGQVAWAAVGEIRGAIQWAPSPVIRVLAGAPGGAVEPPGPVPPLGSGEVAGLALDLGPWMSAIRGSAGDLGLSREAGEFLRGGWDGRLRLSVGEGGPATGSSPLSWRERFPLGARLGVRQDQGFFREVGVPVAGGPGTGEGTVEQAPPGTDLRFVLPVLGEVRGVLAGGEIRVTAGPLDPGALPGGSLELEGGLIAWMRVDWQRVVRGLGGDSLGLPGHLAAVIREVRGRVFRQGARVVVEAGLSGWQEADR